MGVEQRGASLHAKFGLSRWIAGSGVSGVGRRRPGEGRDGESDEDELFHERLIGKQDGPTVP